MLIWLTARFCVLTLLLVWVPQVAAETTAFMNVQVVPMDAERHMSQQTVIVNDGSIVAIGPVDEVPIPEGALVVDGTDRYLMPGLAEMHAHVPRADSPNIHRYFSLYVANGVTTIRGMLGQPSHLELRDALEAGNVFGPRLYTSGPSLNGRSVNGPAEARTMTEEQHAAGYDFIKLHPGLTREEFETIAATANRLGIPFAGHVPVAVGVEGALESGMATIDHLDNYLAAAMPPASPGLGGYGGFFDVLLADQVDVDRILALATATASSDTWNVPTQILVEVRVNNVPVEILSNWPEMRYMPAETVARWVEAKTATLAERGFNAETAALGIELRRRLLLELQRAGAGLLLGSDSPQVFSVPGFSIHRELAVLVAAGLTPYEALRSGTASVAEYFGSNGGIVAVGRDADLMLLDADPLADIANASRIHGVMLRGAWYPAAQLDERIARFRREN
ncbi:MAG: amidohydrolase family protein [Woeseiaceae bacterium]|nr:amidohydrolase family protein [Woeseiaceae bacterium]